MAGAVRWVASAELVAYFELWATSDVAMVGLIHRANRNSGIREMVTA